MNEYNIVFACFKIINGFIINSCISRYFRCTSGEFSSWHDALVPYLPTVTHQPLSSDHIRTSGGPIPVLMTLNMQSYLKTNRFNCKQSGWWKAAIAAYYHIIMVIIHSSLMQRQILRSGKVQIMCRLWIWFWLRLTNTKGLCLFIRVGFINDGIRSCPLLIWCCWGFHCVCRSITYH